MPQPGEIRYGQTETVQWDGTRWNPIKPQEQSASGDSGITGFAKDLAHGAMEHPLDTLKGFFHGAAGAATPGKLGALAALTTGGASIPAQMLTAGGATALADLLQVAEGTDNAPKTLGGGVRDVVGSAATAGLMGGAAKVVSKAGGPVRAALDVGSHIPVIGKYARLLRALMPEGEAAVTAAEKAAGDTTRYKWTQAEEMPYRGPSGTQPTPDPNPYPIDKLEPSSTHWHSDRTFNWDQPKPDEFIGSMGPDVPTAQEMPGGGVGSMGEYQEMTKQPWAGPTVENELEKILSSLRQEGPAGAGKLPDTPSVRSVDRGNLSLPDSLKNLEENAAPVADEGSYDFESGPVDEPSPVGAAFETPGPKQLDVFGDTSWPDAKGSLVSTAPTNDLTDFASQGDTNAARALRQRQHIHDWAVEHGLGSSLSGQILPNR